MEFSADGFFGIVFGVAFAILVAFGLFALYETATASGKVDYCYINQEYRGYDVIGHRPWRPDVHLGLANSPMEANEVLKNSLVCPH